MSSRYRCASDRALAYDNVSTYAEGVTGLFVKAGHNYTSRGKKCQSGSGEQRDTKVSSDYFSMTMPQVFVDLLNDMLDGLYYRSKRPPTRIRCRGYSRPYPEGQLLGTMCPDTMFAPSKPLLASKISTLY